MSDVDELDFFIDDHWDRFLAMSHSYLLDKWTWEDERLGPDLKFVEVLRELRPDDVANIQYSRGEIHMTVMIDDTLCFLTATDFQGIDIIKVSRGEMQVADFLDDYPNFFQGLLREKYSKRKR